MNAKQVICSFSSPYAFFYKDATFKRGHVIHELSLNAQQDGSATIKESFTCPPCSLQEATRREFHPVSKLHSIQSHMILTFRLTRPTTKPNLLWFNNKAGKNF